MGHRVFALFTLIVLAAQWGGPPPLQAQPGLAAMTVDYPLENSLFPPDIVAPTFLWRDPVAANNAWRVEITFANGSPPVRLDIAGETNRVGEIDPRCIAPTNRPPELTAEQAAARIWKPDPATWSSIKRNSMDQPATVTFTGLTNGRVSSRGQVRISTSRDPVGAPIFFRDVPLMPAELEKGVIRPLPKPALPLVAWRLRYVNEEKSRLLTENLPTCANCHSFSRDGKTLGIDVDGPANDKGLYALVPINKTTTIANQDVIAWKSFRGKLTGETRIGFMSQVSPDSRYVVTMVRGLDGAPAASGPSGAPKLPTGATNFYVANFKDYRFLQVFYPTRGILAWYSRESGKLLPLPGADDPRYVHTNATWSPDGKYLIFARAEARDPYRAGVALAEKANDPNETPVRYDLYRIPFNDGKGGKAEPVRGASNNGMSNSFPKISPDGRWLVYVQARNGLLMRPDSQLYIVPVEGGQARRMNANTPLMNSWHSFSPNGRWLVFSSKARSPYTQMYLTHIDEQGNDSPPILIENATAANRAVNIPEFVNIGPDAWTKIEAPATEFYRISDVALELLQQGKPEEAVREWRKALEMDPEDPAALSNFATALDAAGKPDDALSQIRKALELDPDNYKSYTNFGVLLQKMGRLDEAVAALTKAIELNPDDAKAESSLGGVLLNQGKADEAMAHLKKALEIDPVNSDANNNLGGLYARAGRFAEAIPLFRKSLEAEPDSFIPHYNLGRALAANGELEEGIRHLEKAVTLAGPQTPLVLDRLCSIYAGAGRIADAAAAARKGIELARQAGAAEILDSLTKKLAEFESRK